MKELDFIAGLMKDNYNSLGFIPYSGIERYIKSGRYIIQTNGNKPIGYMLYSVPKPYEMLKVAQTVIDFDYREKGFGHDIISEFENKAILYHCSGISLRVAIDLEANKFWLASGYNLIETIPAKSKTSRPINVYRKVIAKGLFD